MIDEFRKRIQPAGLIALLMIVFWLAPARAENWPRWRGPDGNAVSAAAKLPTQWSRERNVHWKTAIPGEGTSSPIVWNDRIFLTSAQDDGTQRIVHCLDRATGTIAWSRTIDDPNPEIASSLTGHAAATPVTDGTRVVAMFGNAGCVCYDFDGGKQWHRKFGEFESELGFASSPIIVGGSVVLVCDHDGSRFRSFDSFLIALDLKTGETRWKTERPGLFRSWSTPILVPAENERRELIVAAQDEVRGYDPRTGRSLWAIAGMTGWVAPSPVFGDGLIFATSGREGPVMALRPGGRNDATASHIAWQVRRGAPYVCSPLLYRGVLYVHNEQGILTGFAAKSGALLFRERMDGKFTASGIAGDGKVYLMNEGGETFVLRAGRTFELVARNRLDEEVCASPAVAGGNLLVRTASHLYCIGGRNDEARR